MIRIAIAIATTGRPAILAETLAELSRQHRPPDRLLVCCPDAIDAPALPPGVERLIAPRGLAAQRNRILDAIADCDLVVFFDDDFFPAPAWLQRLEALFAENPDLVAATGAVIADGVRGPGIPPAAARALLHGDRGGAGLVPVGDAYGCNMALRLSPMRQHALRFDEALPLHGWFEDVDLTRRLGAFGRIVRDNSARGVHLGVKLARGPGLRTGYSQVANPVYLARKGSCPPRKALRTILRNLAANFGRAAWPEPWVDRRGRLRGNLRALADALRGRLSPGRILDL